AGLDAFAAEYAGARPFARHLGTIAGSHDVEDACNRGVRIGAGDTGRLLDGTSLEALAARRAGVDHDVDSGGKCGLEGARHGGPNSCRSVHRHAAFDKWAFPL